MLRRIPRSELRKRRAYWKLVRKAMGYKDEDEVDVEKTGLQISPLDRIIGED